MLISYTSLLSTNLEISFFLKCDKNHLNWKKFTGSILTICLIVYLVFNLPLFSILDGIEGIKKLI